MIGMAALFLSACGAQTISPPPELRTETSAGNYLAARQALYFNDVEQSAEYFLETLKNDSSNVDLLRQSFVTQYYYGDIEKAAALGRQLESLNVTAVFGREPATAIAIRDKDWAAVQILADSIAETSPAIGMAGLIKGWALVASGQGDAGITALLEAGRAEATADQGMPHYFRLHAALMAESLGHADEAVQRARGLATEALTTQIAFQLAYLLHRNGEVALARDIVDDRMNGRYDRKLVLRDLNKQRAAPALHEAIAAGIVDAAIEASGSAERRLLTARLQMALFLNPDNDFAHYLLAQQFIDLGKYASARTELKRIRHDGALGQPAQLALYDLANEEENFDLAVKLVSRIIQTNPDNGYLQVAW